MFGVPGEAEVASCVQVWVQRLGKGVWAARAELSPEHLWFMGAWALCLQFGCTLESAALIQPFNGCTCFVFP